MNILKIFPFIKLEIFNKEPCINVLYYNRIFLLPIIKKSEKNKTLSRFNFIKLRSNYKQFLKKYSIKTNNFLSHILNVSYLLNTNIKESSFFIKEFQPVELNFFHLENLKLGNSLEFVEYIKIQELTFLPEYYLISILFCVTLFSLFSLKFVITDKSFSIKFQYNNQLLFLLIFGLISYLVLISQQMDVSLLALTSFNDTIYNDQLSLISKFIIGLSSLLYLIFISKYLKNQRLSNFEYYIITLTSIFGFFLLCGASDLMTAYLAIELQGLAFYVLASFKKSSNFSVESGVKYFVLGSLSTAIFLLGTTFIYGLSGSVLLTDFKDFFIWVFTANSFFLSFESIFKALESFQEKISMTENSNSTKLQIILDKLELFKKKTYLLPSDIQHQKPNGLDVKTVLISPEENDLYRSISEKMITLYNNIDNYSYFYYRDHLDEILKNQHNPNHEVNVLKILPISVDFEIVFEKLFQNISVGIASSIQDNPFNDNNPIDLKKKTILTYFYEYEDMIVPEDLQDLDFILSNSDKITERLFSSLPIFLLSDMLVYDNTILLYKEPTDDLLLCYNKYLGQIGSDIKLNSNNGSNITTHLSSEYNKPRFTFSVINILNCSQFYLELFDKNSLEHSFMFDFSFVIFGLLIILFAIFFKLALAPFHLWAPDIYEGSPSSTTFFFMIISKFSLFIFLLRICYSSFYSLISYWQLYSLIVATMSVFIGAVAGLKQRRLKSLLTYSSINNMGFVLLALSVGSFEGIQATFYYLIIYIISGLCIWSIIINFELKKTSYVEKQNRDLGDFVLLQESNNIVAQSLAITLFTLAGLPPMVGFLVKMGVFKALSGVSIYFFSFINILFSVIATFYYIRVIKILFFENLLIGKLFNAITNKKIFLINLLTFLLIFLFICPTLLYFYSYKITLFLNKTFY